MAAAAIAMFGTATAQHRQLQHYPQRDMSGNTGFYISVQGGYNFALGKQNVGFFGLDTWESGMVNYVSQSGPNSAEYIPVSLGKGGNIGVNLGYMMSEHMGMELGLNYLLGSKYQTTQRNDTGTDIVNQTLFGNMFQLSPTAVFRSGSYRNIRHYAKVGLLLGLGTKVTYEEDQLAGGDRYFSQQELTGGVPLGLTGSLGMEYSVNNRVSLFGEVKGNSLTYRPEEGRYVRMEENGADYSQYLSTAQKETVFTDNINTANTANSPSQHPKISLPFSSLGLNVGLRFKF